MMWQQLIEVLEKLCTTYDELAKLGEKQRDALVAVNIKELSKILEQEKAIFSNIQNLDKRRKELLQELSEDTPAENFYETAPTVEMTAKLKQIHKQLSENVERALKLRDHNQILAQTALDNVTFKLNQLGGAFVEPTYGAKGSIVTHQKKFDYHA